MSAESNKARMRRFVDEVQNSGRLDRLPLYISEDFLHHGDEPFERPAGVEGALRAHRLFRDAFPDHDAAVHHMVAEEDLVMTHKTFSGTHRGTFLGVAPTGRHVTIRLIDVVRERGGMFVEHWNVIDYLGLLRQLGLNPTPQA